MREIRIEENRIQMRFEINEKEQIKLMYCSTLPETEKKIPEGEKGGFRIVEVNLSGLDRPEERHGTKYIVTAPGYCLKYHSHSDYRNELGRKLEILTVDDETGTYVTSHYQFYDGIPVIRSYTDVSNHGRQS